MSFNIKPISALFFLLLSSFLSAQSIKYEAENAELNGVQVAKQISGYSGTGYVTGFDKDGDNVVFKFNIETGGKYQLFVGYAATSGNKNNFVKVNGDNLGDLLFAKSTGFQEMEAGNVVLNKGENTVSIEKSWGWFEVDYIRFDAPKAAAAWNISTDLVNPNASSEAKSLMKYLVGNFGKTTLAGQFQSNDYLYKESSSDIAYVKSITGKYPAVYGNDLIDYSPSRVANGSKSKALEDISSYYNEQHGIITLTWHWNAPTDLYNTSENPWWSGFYTRATSFNIREVLKDKEGEKYQLVLRDIDAIAIQLKKLQAQHIPILWRPLHEAEGAWFWWGAQGPEACVELWQLLYDRLTNHHQINNLIWVWTTTDSPSAMKWYPGDAYVDVLGVDVYLNDGDYSASTTMFNNLRNLFKGEKLLTMSENGTIPSPEKMYSQEAHWSYFCTWVGDFIKDGKKNSRQHVIDVFNDHKITTADELPSNWDTMVGFNQLKNKSETTPFEVFPNPFQNKINLTFNGEMPNSISVFDVSGKKTFSLHSKNIDEITSISLEQLPAGVYFIQLHFTHRTEMVKAIKS